MSREEQDALVTKYLRAFVTGEKLESGRFTGGKPVASRTPDGWDAGKSTALPRDFPKGEVA